MNLADGRLAPAPGGDGLVARTSGAVLFVAARTPADDVALLVDALQGASGPTPARDLARALARVVSDDADTSLPGFAVVADSGSGVYVRVYGPVEVELQGDGGVETLTGVGSYTGVDRELAGTFHTIVAHRAGEPAPAPAFDVDLGAGSVPATGFALTTMSSPTDAVVADIPPAMDEQVAPSDEAAMGGAAAAAAVDAPLEQPTQAWSPEDVQAATGDAEASPAAPVVEPPVAEGVPAEDSVGATPTPSEAPPAMAEPPTMAVPPAGAEPPSMAEAPSDEPPGLDDLPVVEVPDQPSPPADMAGGEVRSLEDLPIADEPSAADAPPAEAAPEGAAPEAAWTAEPLSDGPPSTAEPLPVAGEAPSEPPGAPAAPAADPGAAPAAAGGFTSQLLGALDVDEVEERDALPVEPEPGEVRQAEQFTSEVIVQGIVCSRGHFNDPRSRYCSSCGISMVHVTNVLTNGPRPPLGVIVFEDGAAFSLSTDYVVGRQPEVSELVRDGLALPLTVDDPERSISRAHAELRLVDWDVHLVNLSGTNGSFVWDEAAQQWISIPEGQSVVLTPGMRVALGRRSAVFESSLR